VDKLVAQCKQFRPEYAVVGDADHAAELEKKLKQNYCMKDYYNGTVFSLGEKVKALVEKADLLTLEIGVVPLKDIF